MLHNNYTRIIAPRRYLLFLLAFPSGAEAWTSSSSTSPAYPTSAPIVAPQPHHTVQTVLPHCATDNQNHLLIIY